MAVYVSRLDGMRIFFILREGLVKSDEDINLVLLEHRRKFRG